MRLKYGNSLYKRVEKLVNMGSDFWSSNKHFLAPQLKVLRLGGNKVGDAGAQALADAIAGGKVPQLERLSLNGNPASEAAQQAVEDAIKKQRV